LFKTENDEIPREKENLKKKSVAIMRSANNEFREGLFKKNKLKKKQKKKEKKN
jgi:CDP-diacylglycerol pyrophosphatase